LSRTFFGSLKIYHQEIETKNFLPRSQQPVVIYIPSKVWIMPNHHPNFRPPDLVDCCNAARRLILRISFGFCYEIPKNCLLPVPVLTFFLISDRDLGRKSLFLQYV